MTSIPSSKKTKIETVQPLPKPVLTLLMVCLMPLGLSDGHINWAALHAFTARHFHELLAANDYQGLFSYLAGATFGELTPWIFVLNIFFVWTFGSLVEQKLRTWRYPLFLLIGFIGSWYLVAMQAGFNAGKMYIGPSMFLFYLLGGYLAFLPKKPFKPSDWVKPAWKIFREDSPPPIFEQYWVSPWMFIILFAIYSLALQYSLSVTKDQLVNLTKIALAGQVHLFFIGRMDTANAAFAPLPALETIMLGAAVAYALVHMVSSATVKRPGGELQLQVLQHYRELRALDMTHEQACEGAAKFTAVPVEIARDWITKGVAALKDKSENS